MNNSHVPTANETLTSAKECYDGRHFFLGAAIGIVTGIGISFAIVVNFYKPLSPFYNEEDGPYNSLTDLPPTPSLQQYFVDMSFGNAANNPFSSTRLVALPPSTPIATTFGTDSTSSDTMLSLSGESAETVCGSFPDNFGD
jgi:hypothetical protein